jgi:hypothetical protein
MGLFRELYDVLFATTFGTLPPRQATFTRANEIARRRQRAHDARMPPELPPRRRRLSKSSIHPQTCALLTRLPVELRIMIYEEVLGHSILHVVSLPGRMGVYKCPIPYPADSDYRRTCIPLKRTFSTDGVRHPFLPASMGELYPKRSFPISQLPLLQTCRQIYVEAIDILYSTNTFDFEHPEYFIWFVRTIRPSKLATISSLQIMWHPATYDLRQWSDMCAIISTQMLGLKYLSVWLSDWDLDQAPQQDRLVAPLLWVRGLREFNLHVGKYARDLLSRNIPVALTPLAKKVKRLSLQEREGQSMGTNVEVGGV